MASSYYHHLENSHHNPMSSVSYPYVSPQHSPELAFGSPSMSQERWAQPRTSRDSLPSSMSMHSASSHNLRHTSRHVSHSLPSPPHSFAPLVSEYHDQRSHSSHANPPSPPVSDGILSPSHSHHGYDKKITMDTGLQSVWMPLEMKHEGPIPLTLQDSNSHSHSPPPLYIEDILRAEDPHNISSMSNGFMDDQSYQDIPMDISIKRRARKNHMGHNSSSGHHSPSPTTNATHRVRKKRHLTEPSEANFHCAKCGKFFSRIWNFNAHLETHDPDRPRPHICPVEDCEKAFVRRTDLTRHQQCVHAKDKKFQCELCNGMFARKDTLRRHEDDGCPKRVDIASRASKSKPVVWNSQALNFFNSMQQRRDDSYIGYSSPTHHNYDYSDTGMSSSSHLPPLSNVVPFQRGPATQMLSWN